MMTIDGPRLAPARGGRPDSLVVLLHGYGSNGDDLIGLAPYLAKAAPGAQFIAPNAPQGVPGAPGGYQWFPISRLDPRELERGVAAAASVVDKFLDRELQLHGLDESRLILGGFSQGAMLTLHVGPRRARAPAGLIAMSGLLAGADKLKAEARSKPPILLIHGDRDDMIPVTALFDAAQGLCAADLGAQWHISYGVPHSVGPDGLDLAAAFVGMALRG